MPPVRPQAAPHDDCTQESREGHHAGAHEDHNAGQGISSRCAPVFRVAAASALKVVELGWRRPALP